MSQSEKKLRKDWNNAVIFLMKPSSVVYYVFIILQIFSAMNVNGAEKSELAVLFLNIISPIIATVLGIWIAQDLSALRQKNIYENQGEPAISALEGIKIDILRRIKIYKARIVKIDVINFMEDMITRIDGAIRVWKTLDDNKSDFNKEYEDTKKEMETEEEKALKIINEKEK